MSSKKKTNTRKRSFRPAIDEAISSMHDEHIKKVREEENI